jgi:2-succinyl-5-enolpyruvyl-6-hydroxy-3-cyclohexene-1-carboxylate synthase
VSELLDAQAEWASLVITTLADAGIADLVISPGSRSAPLVLAAARSHRLRITDVLDERVAAFFALGRARLDNTPVALLCTSGSAGAHYLPAIVEAAYAHVPLVAITADRPVELGDCGAPQTIDQVRLFGEHARGFIELGAPDPTPSAFVALRRRVAQAVELSRAPLPGAVHINARFRKPLEPRAASSDLERELATHARALAISRAPRIARAVSTPPVDELVELLRDVRRPVIACGPAPVTQATARAAVARLGWPVFAEATSQLRLGGAAACDAFDALVRSPAFRHAFAPDAILQLGAAPTSSAFATYCADHANARRAVIAPYSWPDPASTARLHVRAEIDATMHALIERVARPEPTWTTRLDRANAAAWRAIDGLVAEEPELGEARVARVAVASVPRGGLLAVGNSLPVRMVDTVCPASLCDAPVISQRGASGIDGLISGAAGAAASGRPVTLLVGDLSLLHDIGGLAIAAGARVPLVICVVNNGGGRIFEQLPIADNAAIGHFTTPHAIDLSRAAALYGIAYARATTADALATALGDANSRAGATLVDAVVEPHSAARLAAALPRAVERALIADGLV